MEVRVLRYFLAVAQEESISAASAFLHVSQPTLSRQLMDLEQQLDTKLFDRGNRKISLTAEGMFFRKRAQDIVDLVDKTEADFLSTNDIVSGEIHIGAGETDGMRIVAHTTKLLHNHYPHIRFHLYSGNAEDVMERLDKGLLDFGILIEPADIKKYDYLRLPDKDHWGVLMRKDSPLAAMDCIHPFDLWDVPLITSRQSMVSSELSGWINKSFEELDIVTTYNLIYNAAKMVEEGVGYAITLDKLINTTGSNLCFRFLEPCLECNLVIVWKKYQIFSKPSELFLKYLKQSMAERS